MSIEALTVQDLEKYKLFDGSWNYVPISKDNGNRQIDFNGKLCVPEVDYDPEELVKELQDLSRSSGRGHSLLRLQNGSAAAIVTGKLEADNSRGDSPLWSIALCRVTEKGFVATNNLCFVRDIDNDLRTFSFKIGDGLPAPWMMKRGYTFDALFLHQVKRLTKDPLSTDVQKDFSMVEASIKDQIKILRSIFS